MLIDSHCHIQFQAYNDDREAVILRAKNAGVKMIAVGTKQSTSENAIAVSEKHKGWIWATVGFHPTHVVKAMYYHDKNEEGIAAPEVFDIQKLRAIATRPEVVAIGECGLDYYRMVANRESQIAEQKRSFVEQIELAKELSKPLMIHARASKGTDDAYEDILNILRTSNFQHPTILHFYAGSLAVTKKFVDAEYYFTFGGVITFTRDYDEIIKYIPLDRIMLETDAPYVAPTPYRGERNEPAYVVEVARKLAEIKNIRVEEAITAVTANALAAFRILL